MFESPTYALFGFQDLVSYNKERTTGAVHNIVTVVLKQPPVGLAATLADKQSCTPQDAVDWVVAYHAALEQQFHALYEKLTGGRAAVASSRDNVLLSYANGLGNWVRANDQWSFESARYFGARGLEVKKTRAVELVEMPGER